MSIFDALFGNTPATTNLSAIAEFERNLDEYEAAIVHDSIQFEDFRRPANSLKQALKALCTSDVADTISMMRRLMARVTGNLNDKYSDYAVNMLASATHDREARELIMAIVFNARELIIGENVELGEAWLALIQGNAAVLEFFENYRNSDQGCEESYSGDAVTLPKTTERFTLTDLDCKILIGNHNYDIRLVNGEQQTVSFGVVDHIRETLGVDHHARIVLTSDVILTPSIGYLTLDRTLSYSDDAIAQFNALRCAPAGVTSGCDVRVILPGLFYSLMLSIISYDEGKSWRVVETNILPPSVSRSQN